MPRYFTLAQAQALLPEVEPAVRQAVSLKESLDEVEDVLRGEAQRIQFAGGALVHRDQLLESIKRRDAVAEQLRPLLAAIQEHGCLIKDLDTGLIDFPTLFRDEEVYLCWKLGELEIGFWHAVSDGFRGRKPIDQEFLDNHRGES